MRLTTRTVDTWRTPDGVAVRADVVQDIERPEYASMLYLAGDFLPTSALLAGTTTVAAGDPRWATASPDPRLVEDWTERHLGPRSEA